MIKIENLCKRYDEDFVLKDLSMNVKKGSIYALVGTNGAGKSTLLNTLAGVYRADGGSVKINGEDVYENNNVKKITAYITDEPFYFTGSSMKEMAEYLDKMYDSFSMDKFKKITEGFPLDVNKRISSFSKGMKRQAAIILALAQNPDLLLCDECFDGLDPVVRQAVKSLFVSEVAEREMTIVISSHNLREMENLCDTIGIIHDNKIVLERSLGDIKENMHRYSAAYKPMIALDKLYERLDIVSLNNRGNIIEIVVRGSGEETEKVLESFSPILIDEAELSLEDIFICEMEATGYDFSKILL